jgi:hypothetical protein
MRLNARRRHLGAAVLIAGLLAIAYAPSQAADVPEDVLETLIKQDAAHIGKLLKEPRPEKKIVFIKSNAMMLAAYAQGQLGKGSGSDAKYAALRHNALKIAEAGAAKKIKDAIEPAKALTAAGGDTANIDTKPLKLHELHKFDLHELMAQYKKTAVGGLNIEEDIKNYAKKGGAKPLDAAAIAARTLTTAEFLDVMEPDEGFNPKKPKKIWEESNEKQKVAAKELLQVAKEPKADAKKLQAAFGKLDAACIMCHDTFK